MSEQGADSRKVTIGGVVVLARGICAYELARRAVVAAADICLGWGREDPQLLKEVHNYTYLNRHTRDSGLS